MSENQEEIAQQVEVPLVAEPVNYQNNFNGISTKKMQKKEEKLKKKDDKTIEQILKSLNSINSPDEKLVALCKKYTDILDENRKMQVTMKQNDKILSITQKEKEQLQTDHNKAVLARSRLESLCRELQRQNKAIKDESLLKIRDEEEKRKDVSAKFQNTLGEITTLMQENNDKNSKLREDNLEMTKSLKTVCEQYEIREKQVNTVQKQMQLESQLSDAKLHKLRVEMNAEKQQILLEKQQLLMELTQYQDRIQHMQATEIDLRNQITLYTSKYDEFQKALIRSNDVFTGFKTEMEKMTKKITKLEKETATWKQRWEKSHQALLEMAADRQQRDGEFALANRQLTQLQKLCRTLQTERASLLEKLKISGSENIEKTIIKKCETSNNKPKEENLETSFNALSVCPVSNEDTKEPNNENPSNDIKTENTVVNSDSNIDDQIETSNDTNPIQIEQISNNEIENEPTPMETNKNSQKNSAKKNKRTN